MHKRVQRRASADFDVVTSHRIGVGVTAPATVEASTQTELQMVDAALQAPGCREHLESLSDARSNGSPSFSSLLKEMYHQVEELKEEVRRLHSIREAKREMMGSSLRHDISENPTPAGSVYL